MAPSDGIGTLASEFGLGGITQRPVRRQALDGEWAANPGSLRVVEGIVEENLSFRPAE